MFRTPATASASHRPALEIHGPRGRERRLRCCRVTGLGREDARPYATPIRHHGIFIRTVSASRRRRTAAACSRAIGRDRRVGEVRDGPAADRRVVRGMGRVEEVTELLVRLVVAAGRKVDDPAGVPRLGQHAVGLCPERDALNVGHPRPGTVDVAPIGEVDRLAHVGGREIERLPRFDPEPQALVEVGCHGRQRPEVNRGECANRQRPGEQAQPALLAEAADRGAEELDGEVQRAHPEGGRAVSPSVGSTDGLPDLARSVSWTSSSSTWSSGAIELRKMTRASVLSASWRAAAGDLRTDLRAGVQPPASGRSELEQRQAQIGLAVLPGPLWRPRRRTGGSASSRRDRGPAERQGRDPGLASILEHRDVDRLRFGKHLGDRRPCGRSRSRRPRRAGAACHGRDRPRSGWPLAGAPPPRRRARRAGSPDRPRRRAARPPIRRARRSRPRDARPPGRSRPRRRPGRRAQRAVPPPSPAAGSPTG